MSSRKRPKVAIAKVADIPPGTRKIVEIDGRSIGVFNVSGTFVAVLNFCPHQGGAVCQGRVFSKNLPETELQEVLACPDHNWEFDLRTGRALDHEKRLMMYPVLVENGTVYVIKVWA
jgi:nitrite reductase (NADH) small subunit